MAKPVSAQAPRGVSFSIPEHLFMRRWALRRNLRVVTELDRVVAGEEFEEVIAFYDPNSSWRRLTLWRKENGIVLEPTVGAAKHFPDMQNALEAASGIIRAVAANSLGIRLIRRSRTRQQSTRLGPGPAKPIQ